MKSIGSNTLRILVSMGSAFVMLPFLIRTLGKDGNDCWLIINSSVGMLGLVILGVPMATVRFFAEHVARKDLAALNRAVSSAFGLYLALGAGALVVGGGLYWFYDGTQKIDPAWVEDGRAAFLLMTLSIGAGFVSQLPQGILVAHHEFGPSNAVLISGILLRFGLTLGTLQATPSVTLLAGVQLAGIASDFLLGWAAVRRHCPGVKIGLHGFDRAVLRQTLTFSVFVLLLNLGSKLAFSIDALVIGSVRTDGWPTYYNSGNQFMSYLTDLMLAVGAVVMPLAVKLKTQGRDAEMRQVFLRWSRITFSLSLLAGLYLFVLGPEFIATWTTRDQKEPAGNVLRILVPAFLLFLPARAVAMPVLMGRGNAARPALAFLAMGVLNLVISLALIHPLGLEGVAIGTALPLLLFAAVVVVLACRELQSGAWSWVRYVFGRPLIGAIPVIALLVGLESTGRITGWGPLIAAGIATTLLFALISVAWVYRNDPHTDSAPLVARLRAMARRPIVWLGFAVLLAAAALLALVPDARTAWIAAGAALAALLLAETGARAWIRRRGRHRVWKPHTRMLLETDLEVLPQMEPRIRFEVNAEGERGDAPPPPRDTSVFRVLVAGGSAAECYFLDQKTSWPGHVQTLLSRPDALRQLGRRAAHVGNVARSLYGGAHLDSVFEKVLPQYERLDLVVVMVGATDVVKWLGAGAPPDPRDFDVRPETLFAEHPTMAFGLHPRRWALSELARRLALRSSRAVDLRQRAGKKLGDARAARAAAKEMREAVPDPGPMLDRFERSFRSVLRRASSRARVLVVHQPCFDREHTPAEEAHFWSCGIGDPYHDVVTTYYRWSVVGRLMRLMNDRAAQIADEMGIQRVDLMSRLDRSLATYYDYFHFTPAGSRRVAEIVAEAILAPGGVPAGEAAPARG